MTEAERRAALEQVAAEVRACTRCRLHEGRMSAVPGEGHPSTEVMLVGEAPGLNEDRQGRPFVGAAGGFLTELLGTVGWSREEVFITNVVKCRPPQNRDPEPDEIAACASFLRRQVEILDPALVVTLGRHSMGRFMPGARIGQVHGTTASPPEETGAGDALVFAMYHPAAALHQGSLRQTLLDDMAGAPRALLEARRRREEAQAAQPADPIVPSEGVESEDGVPLQAEPAPGDEPERPIVSLRSEDDARLAPSEGVQVPFAAEAEPLAAVALASGAEPAAGVTLASAAQPASPDGTTSTARLTAGAEPPAPAESAEVPAPEEAPAPPALTEAPPPDGPPSLFDGPAGETGPGVLPPALVPGLEAPATDQMTLF